MVRCKFILFIFFLRAISSLAQYYPDAKVDSLIKAGVDYILNQNYDLSFNISDDLERAAPELPLAELNSAAIFIMQAFDYENKLQTDKVDSLLDAAEDKCVLLLEKDNSNPWNIFFMGSTKGFKAYSYIAQNDYLAAFTEGYFSVQYFFKCLAIDSTFYEAYMPIGTYLYWRSVKTEFFRWLPFIDDETERGIQMLTKAFHKQTYNKYLTANSLLWVYINDKNYEAAAGVAQSMLDVYPDNRLFLLGLARAYQDNYPQRAIDIFRKVLFDLESIGKLNNIKRVVLLHRTANLYSRMNEFQKSLETCDEILGLNYSEDELLKLNKRLKRVEDLRTKNLEILREK